MATLTLQVEVLLPKLNRKVSRQHLNEWLLRELKHIDTVSDCNPLKTYALCINKNSLDIVVNEHKEGIE